MVSPILTAVLGFLIERLMIRRVYLRDPVYSLLLTFGLAFIIQDVCRYIWGPNGLPMTVPDILSTPLSPELFFITWYRIFMVVIVVAAVLGLFAFLRFTRVGIRIRAGTLDLDTVSVLGVNVGMFAILQLRPSSSKQCWPGWPVCWLPHRTGRTSTRTHGRRPADCPALSPSLSAVSAA